MKSSIGKISLLAALLFGTIVGPTGAKAALEAVAFGVKYYGGSGECPGSDLGRVYGHNNTYLYRWDSWLKRYGYTRQQWLNKAVDEKDFVAANNVYPYGMDWADVILYRGHGHYGGCGTSSPYAGLSMGDSNNNGSSCSGNCCTAGYSQMPLGDEDANAMFAITCHGLQWCVANSSFHDGMRNGSQFGMFASFHGYQYSSYSDIVNHWKKYLDWAEYNHFGERWVIEMTNYDASGSKDNCALANVWGSNESDVDDYYYNSGFKDYHSVGWGVSKLWWIEDCDPGGGPKLP